MTTFDDRNCPENVNSVKAARLIQFLVGTVGQAPRGLAIARRSGRTGDELEATTGWNRGAGRNRVPTCQCIRRDIIAFLRAT